MERARFSPAVLASILASLIVLASIASVYIGRFFSSHTLAAKSKSGVIASACTQSPQNEKVYFVSCGGTF